MFWELRSCRTPPRPAHSSLQNAGSSVGKSVTELSDTYSPWAAESLRSEQFQFSPFLLYGLVPWDVGFVTIKWVVGSLETVIKRTAVSASQFLGSWEQSISITYSSLLFCHLSFSLVVERITVCCFTLPEFALVWEGAEPAVFQFLAFIFLLTLLRKKKCRRSWNLSGAWTWGKENMLCLFNRSAVKRMRYCRQWER